MPGPELRYTYRAKGRYWRFRHKLTGDVPLPLVKGLHWSRQPERAAFMERYAELLAVVESRGTVKPVSRASFAWLVEEYRGSSEFGELADATQLDYGRTLDLIADELGEVRFAVATRNILKAVRDSHAATVRKAHKIKQMLSRLYSWADENDLVPAGFNPAKSIKRLKRKGGDREIVVWSDAEADLFLATAPAHLVTPVLVALYTGQRREDVARMTWQQYQGDVIRVRQSKTTALLDIACHTALRRHLDALPRTAVVICTTVDAKAFTAQGLSEALRRAVEKTPGLPRNRSMHGLRYAAGSRMEEAGCTVAEIESVLGHQTFKMALKYASQRLRAKAAMAKMEAAESA
ncbi:tyrosine-type recombinase/integrase [Sphingomonas bacterium]|uniref:tyrosine-type recombinase/integrase n=1 Tax=Sphingomonas bacterium TaxID=1895847 RepID=UPI0015770C1B|nr:tyrosine-type recombinase/integrase [Sphingomonas bacterium]